MLSDETGPTIGAPVMLAADEGEAIVGGAVHARLLVRNDRPAYASSFEMKVAPRLRRGRARTYQREEMFSSHDILCFESRQRPSNWHTRGRRMTAGLGFRAVQAPFCTCRRGPHTPSQTAVESR